MREIETAEGTLTYDPAKRLGQGSFGSVYPGSFTPSGENKPTAVAVKVFKTNKKDLSGAEEAGAKEAEIQALFDPNNTHYLRHGNSTYLTSTYEEGSCDLWSDQFHNHLQGKSLHERLTLVIALLNKIKEMHDQRVIHLDLKLENILAKIGDTVAETTFRLIDFGLAVRLPEGEAQTSLPKRFGTCAYVAPEVMEIKPVSPKTDIYSITPVVLSLLGVKDPHRLKYDKGEIRRGFWRFGYAVDMQDIPLPDSLRQTRLSAALAYFLYRMHRPVRDERPSALECVTFFTQYSALLKEVESPSVSAEQREAMLANGEYEAVTNAAAEAQVARTAALEKARTALNQVKEKVAEANDKAKVAVAKVAVRQAGQAVGRAKVHAAAPKAEVYAASAAEAREASKLVEKANALKKVAAEAEAYPKLKGMLQVMTAATVLTLGFSGLDCWTVFSAHPDLLAHRIFSIAGSVSLGLALLPLLFYVAQCPKVTPAGALTSFAVAAVLLTLSAVYEHGGLSFIKSLPLPLVFAQAGAALLVLAGMALHYTCTRPAPIGSCLAQIV